MASLSDLKLKYRVLMRTYKYRSYDWTPGMTLRKPPAEARIAVVTTAAFHLPGQTPFDESVNGGDFSYREIPSDADLSSLRVAHKSDAFDASGIEANKNLALPIEDLQVMFLDGRWGPSTAGTSALWVPYRRLSGSRTAPKVAALLADDEVDAVPLQSVNNTSPYSAQAPPRTPATYAPAARTHPCPRSLPHPRPSPQAVLVPVSTYSRTPSVAPGPTTINSRASITSTRAEEVEVSRTGAASL